MKSKIVLGTIIIFSLALTLSGCSNAKKNNNPVLVKTNSPIASSPTGLDSGLLLPHMQSPLPIISSGPAIDKYGSQYVNDAFKTAFAFVYRAQQIPELWEPNTKKNPQYINFAHAALSPLGSYFTPELNQGFQFIIPDLLNPTIKNATALNKNASLWDKLIILPWRHSDGTLPNPKSGDVANYTLMYPWIFQTSVGVPIAIVSNLDGYGSVLDLQFNYLIQQPYGDGKKISKVITTTKDMSFQMVRNKDKNTSKNYPWLIGSWGYINNDTLNMENYNPKIMGVFSNPPTVAFP